MNEKLDAKRSRGRDHGGTDSKRLVDAQMSCESFPASNLEAPHQRRRRAQLGVDRPGDGIRFDEREVVGANRDHGSGNYEIASDVSLLIQLRYLSSPACTGIASSSGTL